MAFKKAFTLPSGITSTYQKIASIEIDWIGRKVTNVVIAYFLDEAAKSDGLNPLDIRRMFLNLPITCDEDIVAKCYTEIAKSDIVEGVEQNAFADAEKV